MEFQNPVWLLLLVPIIAGGLYLRRQRALGGNRFVLQWGAAVMRVAAAAGPALVMEVARRMHVLVVDRSASVDDGFGKERLQELLVAHAAKFHPKDRVGLVLFGGNAVVAASLSPPFELARLDATGFVVDPENTDIAGAMEVACSLLPDRGGGEILLVSDGRETVRASDALGIAATARLRVHACAVGPRLFADFGIASLEAPSEVPPGAAVPLTARIFARSEGAVVARLRNGHGRTVARRELTFRADQERVLQLWAPPETQGQARYVLSLIPTVGRDAYPANDTAEVMVRVGGAVPTLYVSRSPMGRILGKLLAEDPGFDAQLRRPFQLGGGDGLFQFGLFVLDGVTAEDLGMTRMKAIENQVRHRGAGLVVTGGRDGFGEGGFFDTPVERASPVLCDPERSSHLAMVVALDASGSMQAEVAKHLRKIDMARAAVQVLLERLRQDDWIALVPFSENPRLDASLRTTVGPEPPRELARALAALRPRGATSILRALQAAAALIEGREESRRHVLVFSDGVENIEPDLAEYVKLRQRFAAKEVSVSVAVTGGMDDLKTVGFLQDRVVLGGRLYLVEDFALLAKRFIEDLARARGELRREGRFTARAISVPPGVARLRLPAVNRYNRTRVKEAAHTAWETEDNGDPLVAWWYCGLGRSVAVTTSMDADWAPEWRTWGGEGAPGKSLETFWSGLMRWASGSVRRGEVRLRRDGATLRVTYAVEGGGGPAVLHGRLLAPDARPEPFVLEATGTGVFEAALPVTREGLHRAVVISPEGSGILAEGVLFLGPSAERRRVGPDETSLKRWVRGQGRLWRSISEFLPGPPSGAGSRRVDLSWIGYLLASGAFVGACFFRRGANVRKASTRSATWQGSTTKRRENPTAGA